MTLEAGMRNFTTDDPLSSLEAWYVGQCDGDWEHGFGVTIETLDNPGWTLKIDLSGTEWADVRMDRYEVHRSEHNWIIASIKGSKYESAGGPLNLREMISVFISFAEPHYTVTADGQSASLIKE